MLVTARKNYSMIYAYAVPFIECIDTHNLCRQLLHVPKVLLTFYDDEKHSTCPL